MAACRDAAGRRGRLVVTPLGEGKVAIVVPRGGVAVLTMLGVGELRAALRDAVFALCDPELDKHYEVEPHRDEVTEARDAPRATRRHSQA